MLAILAAIDFSLGAILSFIGFGALSPWSLLFIGLALLALHFVVAVAIPWKRA